MKKLSGILLVLLFIVSCQKSENLTIKGNYPNGSGKTVQLEMLNISQRQFIDSVKVNAKGNFKFDFNLKSPELLILTNSKGKKINLMAFPGDKIEITIPDSLFNIDYSLKGSEESEKIKGLVSAVEKTRQQLDSISNALELLEDQEGPEAEVLVSAYQQIYIKQKRSNIRFVVENLNSLASVYALYQRISPDIYVFNAVRDLQYFKIVADSIKVKYPTSTLTASLVDDVNKKMTEYNNMVTINTLSKTDVVETGLIELKIEDVNGTPVSLRSLTGKVVLINFWASWDQGSRDATRALRGIYNKYHGQGFEIYSIALDKNRNVWRAAIDFEEYPWINVSELSYPYSYAATVYNVTSLPTSFLIDREGTIVAKNISGKTLATWLDNLL